MMSVVFVAAHNEERRIARCLTSLTPAEVYVMANGCTDSTAGIASRYAKVAEIPRGDKCNAWNVFVHEVAPRDRDVYYFMDGDVRVCPGALGVLADVLRAIPHLNAVSAVPATGRTMTVGPHDLVGNLYALRGDFVRRIQRQRIRLPAGLVGDDTLIGAMAKYDLTPQGPWDEGRVVSCPAAQFEFDSFTLRDTLTYYRRLVRYTRRRLEFDLLKPVFHAKGFEAMPSEIRELYGAKQRADGLLSWLALRQMRKAAGSNEYSV